MMHNIYKIFGICVIGLQNLPSELLTEDPHLYIPWHLKLSMSKRDSPSSFSNMTFPPVSSSSQWHKCVPNNPDLNLKL